MGIWDLEFGTWNLGLGIWNLELGPIQPEMVFGHNLQHMAPFGIPSSGLCMVFQGATLIFSAPGARFWLRGQILGPRPSFCHPGVRNLGPGPKFGIQIGPWDKPWIKCALPSGAIWHQQLHRKLVSSSGIINGYHQRASSMGHHQRGPRVPLDPFGPFGPLGPLGHWPL